MTMRMNDEIKEAARRAKVDVSMGMLYLVDLSMVRDM